MKTSELRLGNYVKQKSHPTKYTINAITKGGGWIELTDGFEECDSDIDSMEPIELNEDILVKCGFNCLTARDGTKIYSIKDKGYFSSYQICMENDGLELSDGESYRVMILTSLHQLQNLYFAITGEELNIIL